MAKLINPFLQDILPPFDGFPKDAPKFLRELAANNNREWFLANKQRYEESLREPMEALLSGLGDKLRLYDENILIDPKKAIFRIYRDVRFSKDKTPYKTNIAAAFSYMGTTKTTDVGFYFEITGNNVGVGGGVYMPSSEQLKALRAGIAKDVSPLKKAIMQKDFIKLFGELQGEKLSRIPQGFPKDHPEEEFLRMKQFLCWKELPVKIIHDSSFLTILTEHFIAVGQVVKYLAANSK